jgi:hypothetical protein
MLFLSVTEAGEAGALDSVSTTARNRRIFAWHETGPDLRLCPKSDARMAATSSRRVLTRKSVDGGRASRHTPKQAVEKGFPHAERDDR